MENMGQTMEHMGKTMVVDWKIIAFDGRTLQVSELIIVSYPDILEQIMNINPN